MSQSGIIGAVPFGVAVAGFSFVQDLTVSNTTNPAFQTKLSLVVTLAAGTYRVATSYGWGTSDANRNFRGRVQEDAATILTHTEAPTLGLVSQIHRAAATVYRVLAAGAHTFTLQWAISGGAPGVQAVIQEAQLEIWRVL